MTVWGNCQVDTEKRRHASVIITSLSNEKTDNVVVQLTGVFLSFFSWLLETLLEKQKNDYLGVMTITAKIQLITIMVINITMFILAWLLRYYCWK